MCNIAVAPLVGAWIEINVQYDESYNDDVAPLVGAWIEIADEYEYITGEKVAPLVGAWIEIQMQQCTTTILTSLLSWERGLK